MGKKAPSAPAAPDPVALSRTQGEMNERTARANAQMNRVNQVTPQGTLTYSRNPAFDQFLSENVERDRGQYAQEGREFNENDVRNWYAERNPNAEFVSTTQLSPEQQRLYDLTTRGQEIYGQTAVNQLGNVQERMSQPFEFTGGQAMTRPDFTGIGDPNQSRDAVEAALMQRLNPSLSQGRASAENRLRNQGLMPGSEAWNNAIRDVNQQENDARLGVIAQAGQEQSRMFGLGFNQANLNNAAVQQRLQQDLAIRNQPLNEAAALLSGSQVQQPQFNNVPQVNVAPTDYLGAVGMQQSALNNQFQAKNAGYLANLQGMYALGGAALGAGARMYNPAGAKMGGG